MMSDFIQQNSLAEIKNSSNFSELVNLPFSLFNPYRLLILNALYRLEFQSFSQLKEITKVKSDGNLGNHLKLLEKSKYISSRKINSGRYKRKLYCLTDSGRNIVDDLRSSLDIYLSTLSDKT